MFYYILRKYEVCIGSYWMMIENTHKIHSDENEACCCY